MCCGMEPCETVLSEYPPWSFGPAEASLVVVVVVGAAMSSEVSVVPGEARFWPLLETTAAVVSLRNRTTSRLSIKVKCSDNKLYKLRPVYGWVETGAEAAITICRKADKEDKTDKMVIQWVKATGDPDSLDASLEWRAKKAEGQVSIPLVPTDAPPNTNQEDYLLKLGRATPDPAVTD